MAHPREQEEEEAAEEDEGGGGEEEEEPTTLSGKLAISITLDYGTAMKLLHSHSRGIWSTLAAPPGDEKKGHVVPARRRRLEGAGRPE